MYTKNEPQYFKYLAPFALENGQILQNFELAYCLIGGFSPQKDNVIWVCHALTANADPEDWWEGLVGKGQCIDTERFCVICANILGSCYGSSNALSENPDTKEPYYHSFPQLTNRDMVRAFDLLRLYLGIQSIKLLCGGSLGGQHCLEWAVLQPLIFENLFLIATNAFHSAWGIAFNEAQRMAIASDTTWKDKQADAGMQGMGAARAIALLSYRNYETYCRTQTDENNSKTDHFKASSYQNYQAQKLQKRFNAYSYWTLSKAMDSHHLARNRAGSIENTLKNLKNKTLVIGISSDMLFPPNEQRYIAQHLANGLYYEIDSELGHDGFLIENDKIGAKLQETFHFLV